MKSIASTILGAAALGLEGEEAVARPDVEHPLAAQVLRQRKALQQGRRVIDPGRDYAWAPPRSGGSILDRVDLRLDVNWHRPARLLQPDTLLRRDGGLCPNALIRARLTRAVRSTGGVSPEVLVLGVVGAVLVVVAELSSIVHVDVLTTGTGRGDRRPERSRCLRLERLRAARRRVHPPGDRGACDGRGAGRGASRPAAIALVAIGVVVLAFALIRDVPEANETGLVGLQNRRGRGEGRPGPLPGDRGSGADRAQRPGAAATAGRRTFSAR